MGICGERSVCHQRPSEPLLPPHMPVCSHSRMASRNACHYWANLAHGMQAGQKASIPECRSSHVRQPRPRGPLVASHAMPRPGAAPACACGTKPLPLRHSRNCGQWGVGEVTARSPHFPECFIMGEQNLAATNCTCLACTCEAMCLGRTCEPTTTEPWAWDFTCPAPAVQLLYLCHSNASSPVDPALMHTDGGEPAPALALLGGP